MNNRLDSIINRGGDEEALFRIEKEILSHDKPNNWNIWKEGNMERVSEVDFMKFGIAVTRKTGAKLEEMTMFAFYSTVELLSEEKPKGK